MAVTATFKTVLKTHVEALGMQLVHAELFEANYGLDKIKEEQFPVFVLVSPTKFKNSQDMPSYVRRRIDMFGFILKRLPKSTAEYTTEEVYPLYEECRQLGDKLVKKLNADRTVTDHQKDGITEWDMTETAGKFDAHLHGVAFQCFWPTLGLIC